MKTKDFVKLLEKENITIGNEMFSNDFIILGFTDDGTLRQVQKTDALDRTVIGISCDTDDGRPIIVIE